MYAVLSLDMKKEDSIIGLRDGVGQGFKVVPVPFGIPQIDRANHVYTVGQTGTGKSTLLRNMLIQDIRAGRGLVLIDPHGDLAQELIDYVPKRRTNEVVFINPMDVEHPIGINFFKHVPQNEMQRALAVEQVVSVFKHVWDLDDVTTPRLLNLLRNTVAALMHAPNTSVLSIYHLLTDTKYRERILRRVTDMEVLKYWRNEFAKLPERQRQETMASTLNKAFVINASPALRYTLGQTGSKLDFKKLMDNERIIICDLSKGRMGESSSNLLGAMILVQLYMAALARADDDRSLRSPCHVYVDEFQNFGSSSVFSDMLSESRKYGLRLTLAHQFMSQVDPTLQDAVLGNVGSIISFRVGSKDASILAREYAFAGREIQPSNFSDLATHEVVVRLQNKKERLMPFHARTLPPIQDRSGQRDKIVNYNRMHFAKPLATVKKAIDSEFI